MSAGWISRRRLLSNGFVAVVGLLMIGYSAVVFGATIEFPGVWALLPTVGCALVIVSGLSGPNFVERGFLSWRTMQGLGRISYGWYLWHWPLLVIGALIVGRDLTVAQGLELSLLGLWLAICSYIAFETPLRTLPGIAKSSGRGLLLGGVCILLTLALAVAAYSFTSSVRLPGAPATPIASAALIPSVVKAAPAEGGVPDNLDPTLENAGDDLPDLYAADGQSCHAGLLQTTLSSNGTGTCVAGGTEKGTKTVILTGDSHAFQWLPAMEVIAKERNWRLINLTKSACPLYDFQLVSGQLKRDYKECYRWRTLALARISAEHPAMVITSAAIFSTKTADFTNDWNGGVTRTLATLRATGAKLVELDDTPFPRKDIPKCLAAHLKQTEKCDLPRGLSNADPSRRASTTKLAMAAGATTINPFAWFCGAKECPVILGNTLVYRDNSHMTATYAAKLAPLLNQRLPAT